MDLREYLFRNKISVTEFAKRCNYCRSHMSQIVSGKRKPSKKLKKIIEDIKDTL